MKQAIYYIDRKTGKKEKESVYGGSILEFLYGQQLSSKIVGNILSGLISRIPLFSSFYGYLQNTAASKEKIRPFIEKFNVDSSEFLEPIENYHSFNEFFYRKLKSKSRPIASSDAVIPADGRFLFFPKIDQIKNFIIKNQEFNLEQFLQNRLLAQKFNHGTLVIGRLCPTDYHRFHFPCDCIPSQSKLINGHLYSVNPIALKKNAAIFWQNKRVLTELNSTPFGKVLFVEIGATSVGTIRQTFTPYKAYKKGDEKGYFSFGGSAIAMIFEPGAIELEKDLLEFNKSELETLCQMGQALGFRRKIT